MCNNRRDESLSALQKLMRDEEVIGLPCYSTGEDRIGGLEEDTYEGSTKGFMKQYHSVPLVPEDVASR